MLWKIKPKKNLGVMLTHLFGLSILLLQVIIQRAEFFKNITVGAEPEIFNTVGQCGQFSWQAGSYKNKIVDSPEHSYRLLMEKLWAGLWHPCFMH